MNEPIDPSGADMLLACPFCGSQAALIIKHPKQPNGSVDTLFQVKCEMRECGVETRQWYPYSAAVASWNRRAGNKSQQPSGKTSAAGVSGGS